MGDVLKDLTGMRFGKWTVLRRAANRKRAIMWECQCECGNTAIVHGTSLKSSKSTQCRDCRNKLPRSHGLTHHPLYRVWQRMKSCTTNPNHQDYKYYGGRGISLNREWSSNFKSFFDWAVTHGYKPGLSIERIDCDGNYTPENCTWITIQEQQLNKHHRGYLEDTHETICV